MRLLVCGGRDYRDGDTVFRELDRLCLERGPVDCLIHGAATGADSIAALWAEYARIKCKAYPAQWTKHGKAAGPLRNQQMLDEARPDFVVAFPGGRGTADMVRRARKAGVPVLEIDPRAAAPRET
jgi:hypothetical protein